MNIQTCLLLMCVSYFMMVLRPASACKSLYGVHCIEPKEDNGRGWDCPDEVIKYESRPAKCKEHCCYDPNGRRLTGEDVVPGSVILTNPNFPNEDEKGSCQYCTPNAEDVQCQDQRKIGISAPASACKKTAPHPGLVPSGTKAKRAQKQNSNNGYNSARNQNNNDYDPIANF